jgi:hypothetical protein
MRKSRVFRGAASGAAGWALGGWALAADSLEPESAPAPPSLRLPPVAEPVSYAVDLTVEPGAPAFRGSVEMDVRVKQRSEVLWLNAKELQIGKASGSAAGSPVAIRTIPGGTDFVGLVFDHPVEPGPLKLRLEFSGVMDETST